MPAWASSGSPTNRLIVTETFVAEGQVVHAALGSGTSSKGFENYVGDAL